MKILAWGQARSKFRLRILFLKVSLPPYKEKKNFFEKTPTLIVRHPIPVSFSQMCFVRRRSLCGREIRGGLSHGILGFGGQGCVCSGLPDYCVSGGRTTPQLRDSVPAHPAGHGEPVPLLQAPAAGKGELSAGLQTHLISGSALALGFEPLKAVLY